MINPTVPVADVVERLTAAGQPALAAQIAAEALRSAPAFTTVPTVIPYDQLSRFNRDEVRALRATNPGLLNRSLAAMGRGGA